MASKSPSAKQTALLQYLGITVPKTLGEASMAIDEAMNNPSHQDRLDSWRVDRMHLHPDLYQNEISTFKADRVSWLHQENNASCTDIGHPLKRLTKVKCEQAVAWLDANSPSWDKGGMNIDTFYDHFIPVIENLFPDCVRSVNRRGFDAKKVEAYLRIESAEKQKTKPKGRGFVFTIFFALLWAALVMGGVVLWINSRNADPIPVLTPSLKSR